MAPEESRSATEVWFTTPRAAIFFDPARLAPADRLAWNSLRTSRRRLDWASSRALRQAASSGAHGERSSSLSHSRGHAALAYASAGVSVGVDIEWLAPRDFLRLACAAFAPEEARELEALDDPAQVCARFYEYWTLKEAFAKALGMPLADALGKCRFAGAGATSATSLPTGQPWRAVVYAPRPMLRLAVACVGESVDPPAAPPATIEWPPRRKTAWTVVRSLEGAGTGRPVPC